MNVVDKIKYKIDEARARRPRVFTEETRPEACNVCGGKQILTISPKVKPDFNEGIIPEALKQKLFHPTDGFCSLCGHYQRLDRLSMEELQTYLSAVESKDQTVGEEAYHTYPVPESFIAGFEGEHFEQRVARWGQYLDAEGVKPSSGRALVMRPFFGRTTRFLLERGYLVDAMEISKIARRTMNDKFPNVRFLEGNIHHRLFGAFLDAGPYDLIVSYHVLQHCAEPMEEVKKMKNMLAPGGRIILSGEIGRKPHNPFHMNHFSEDGLRNALLTVCDRVDVIRDCESSPPPYVSSVTKMGDDIDLVARWL